MYTFRIPAAIPQPVQSESWRSMGDARAWVGTREPESDSRLNENGKQGTRFRTIWISDTHLGTRGCNAHALLEFLRTHESDTLYLVGDIVDGWRLRRSWYWPQSHNDVVQKLLRKARKGTRVIYIPGNHDECFREYVGLALGGIVLAPETIHVTADGRRLLVIHGDQFDGVVRYAKWLALLGDYAYQTVLALNAPFNSLRRGFGLPYWSISAFLKLKVKNAVNFISDFELTLAREARRRDLDGVVCGHIHHAATRRIGDIDYYNDGDWVESCTALVEHYDGSMRIIVHPHHSNGDSSLSTELSDNTPVDAVGKELPIPAGD
jgi:UDP-2,3-diacylglucosamine pyrophosphatase LpxH